jgi:hypothetical protein
MDSGIILPEGVVLAEGEPLPIGTILTPEYFINRLLKQTENTEG